MRTLTILALFCHAVFCTADPANDDPQSLAINDLRGLGAYIEIAPETQAVVNVSFNGNPAASDALMRQVATFSELTDLSLERTRITDAGIAPLAPLKKLEWLNLYQTQIGDASLKIIGGFTQLEQLPIGETKITDKGLSHLIGLNKLHYLGLRGTAVTDAGLDSVGKLPALRRLHLGETAVTDKGISSLTKLPLEQLWLHNTQITGQALPALRAMTTLRRLWIYDTPFANDPIAIATLRNALPKCEIIAKSQ